MSRIALPFVMLAAAIAAGAVLLRTPPQVPKAPPEALVAVVGTAELKPQRVPVFVEAFGTVTAARQVRVQPEVGGRVVFVHPALVPGGVLAEGETLFRIDRADYEIALDEARADLEVQLLQVEQLRAGIETIRNRIAEIEADLEYLRWNAERLSQLSERDQASEAEARDASSQLASRRAALAALRAEIVEQERSVASGEAQANVSRSRVAAAELALKRTEVTAPFNSIVLNESVETGQLVSPQSAVATLAATDEFWVDATIPLARLDRIRYADSGDEPASKVVVTVLTGGPPVIREGRVLRRLGSLDPEGRMARVLISVQDPLVLGDLAETAGAAVLVGSYVRVSIDAGTLEDVVTIPRLALRENSRVWVRTDEGKLDIRDVDVIWRRQDDVLVRDGFRPGDQLIVTHLASVIPGMPVNVREQDESNALPRQGAPQEGPAAGSAEVGTEP